MERGGKEGGGKRGEVGEVKESGVWLDRLGVMCVWVCVGGGLGRVQM